MAPARKSSRKTVQTVTTTVVQAPSTPVTRRLTPGELPASPLGATPRGALPQVYSTPHKNYDLTEEDLSRIAEEAQSTLRNRASLYTAEKSVSQTRRLVGLVKPTVRGRARLLWAIAAVLLALLVAAAVLYWRGIIFNTEENTVAQQTKQ
ncbi:PREDICTED: uncharacterized protein LOC109471619 isoform X1 [Branchiostoma belcheri]|uniref:Uncharacterized protein LOC109471619 isoform X1 n=1 Tax=Branchiostoma belcheri TaxID=7741 RepID=A0A6P4YQ45_BRABE|nr:PREDICTED: uncharacterized protein LOC109471619 isoform X1 [Branchiostoma belcheri]